MSNKIKLKKIIFEVITSVLIFSLIAGILAFEQRGYNIEVGSDDGGLIDEDAWYAIKNSNAGAISNNSPKCLIVFDGNDRESIEVKDNINYVLQSINVHTDCQEIQISTDDEDEFKHKGGNDNEDEVLKISQENNHSLDFNEKKYSFSEFNEIIFCISDLAYMEINYDELYSWVENGGHVMFANGLEANEDLLEWSNLLGITDNSVPEVILAESLKFTSGIMVGAEGREFSDDVINCDVLDVNIDDLCKIHASTCDEEIPLLWEKKISNGSVIVCNAALLNSKADRGLIVATYCQFYPVYAYPVINAAVYCIDDCPAPIPAGYDENVLSQYGYTVSDYIANIWMPAMEKISEEYDIRFTTFTIQSYSDDVEGPFNDQDNIKSAKYYASLILNMGGEIGIPGYNHQPLVLEGFKNDEENAGYVEWPSVKKIVESVEAVKTYTESLADDLYVQAYIAPSNVISDEVLHELQNHFEDLRVYAGVYIGTPDQMVQEFEVLNNGTVYCPRLTADMQMEDSEWWLQINELNYHYVESNFIHPDDILDEERSDGGDFSQMLSSYKSMIEWNQKYGLKTSTISECGAAVQKYCNLNYSQTLDGNDLNIKVDGLIDNAYMMLRLNGKRIVSMKGGTYQKISDDVYVLEINDKDVSVKLVNK